MNGKITLILFVVGLMPTTLFCPSMATKNFVMDTAEEVREAAANLRERMRVGPEVITLRGRQITLSDLPNDKARNQQIYNDIAEYQMAVNQIIQTVMASQSNPFIRNTVGELQEFSEAPIALKRQTNTEYQNSLDIQFKDLIELLTFGGLRYSLADNFRLLIQEARALREDLRQSYREYEIANPNNYYMTIRARLKTLMSEITNLLNNKLAGTGKFGGFAS